MLSSHPVGQVWLIGIHTDASYTLCIPALSSELLLAAAPAIRKDMTKYFQAHYEANQSVQPWATEGKEVLKWLAQSADL